MGPNDVEMVRVWTCKKGADIADCTFVHDEDFEVVVEGEAGDAIWNGGGPFRFDITVRALTHDNTVVQHAWYSGHLGPGNEWDPRKFIYKFGPYKCWHPSGTEVYYDCFEVLAVLAVGAAKPDISFARSPLFVCQKK